MPSQHSSGDEVLREIVRQAYGDDEWVSGRDLMIRVGSIVMDRVGWDTPTASTGKEKREA